MRRLPLDVEIFIAAVTAAAAYMVWLLAPTVQWAAWPELVLFFMLIALAPVFPIPDARGGYITAAGILLYVLVALHGPGAALIVAWPAFAVGSVLSRGWIPWKTISNGARQGMSVALAGLIFHLAGGSPNLPTVRTLLFPLLLAVLTHEIVNNLLVSFYFSRLRGTPVLSTWLQDMRDTTFSNLLSVPTASLLILLYVSLSPLILGVYLISLPLQRRVQHLLLKRRQVFDQAIGSLVLAIDANFPQGRGHSRRVADIAVAIARNMRLPDQTVEAIELGALVHDVGLIGLDEVAIRSPGIEEMARLRDHTWIGAEMVKELPQRDVAAIVLHHHERFDGTGYPQGLKGEDIPLGARIVALAEVFDSLVSGGFHDSGPVAPDEALKRISDEAARTFDPRVVEAFVAAYTLGTIQKADLIRSERAGAAITPSI